MSRFPVGFVVTSMGHTISYEVARRLVSSYAKPIKQRRRVGTMMKKKVAAEQRWICGLCNRLLDHTYQVDHITPLFRGGSNERCNLMAVCPHCHAKKSYDEQMGV
jgi:5-methylcytosine-specific restriction endonuclease McrA